MFNKSYFQNLIICVNLTGDNRDSKAVTGTDNVKQRYL